MELNRFLSALSLPAEFSNSNNQTILAYLRELKFSKPTEIFRMRVMLVGPGEAGKTTLVHRLLTDEFVSGMFSMTDGVSMKDWKISPEMNLSLWDFGGQRVYLNSHAILFSDKTLYLLVWNPRVGIDGQMLDEYLLNIRSRSKSGQVMFVTTHADEVDMTESLRLLENLKKSSHLHIVGHHAIDSKSGRGICELKERITNFVTEDYVEHSRAVVPGWYLSLESKLKELRESKIFSIKRAEFKSECLELWSQSKSQSQRPDGEEKNNSTDLEFAQAVKTVLHLFHHWGLIFILPEYVAGVLGGIENGRSGDIVLDPQSLADVFKCVITCKESQNRDPDLFHHGILNHDMIESIWSEYEPHLRSQFLQLLQDCELCFEIFDSDGKSTNRSLVPSLLPVIYLRGNDEETELREQLFGRTPIVSIPSLKNKWFHEGYVKITFDCLLPNFFPKLMVRLRHLSSPLPHHISRHHFVVHLPELDEDDHVERLSSVCIMEDRTSHSLVLYPGVGSSFTATTICHNVIRELLNESFSGMCLKDLMLSVDGVILVKKKIVQYFKRPDSSMTILCDDGAEEIKISLRFLSPLLCDFDSHLSGGGSSDFSLCGVHDQHSSIEATLKDRYIRFENSRDVVDKFGLCKSLIDIIPHYRAHGLGLSRSPSILWLVGHSSSSPSEYYLYAVSPSIIPTLHHWEIVPNSRIQLTMCRPVDHISIDGSFSELLLKCVGCLLRFDSLPPDITEWTFPFPLDYATRDTGDILEEIREKECSLFIPKIDMYGVGVHYWRDLWNRQRGQISPDEMTIPHEDGEVIQIVVSSLGGERRTLRVSLQELLEICSSHLIEVTTEIRVVSVEGLNQLRVLIGVLGNEIDDDVCLLQIAMRPDARIDDTLKKQLLFGLLLQRSGGLTLLKEAGMIIAPIPEISIPPPSISCQGTISFLNLIGQNIPDNAPDLSSLCEYKGLCGMAAHQIMGFILEKLRALPSAESLSDSFRLKSYSSVMNKLFYRGKDLTDLFAGTYKTDDKFDSLKKQLLSKGAIPHFEKKKVNGNDCLVYRYVRILKVDLSGGSFTFPVYYELVRENFKTSTPHEHYELTRLLQWTLVDGHRNMLVRNGFSLENF